ncbi:prepilin-type N-terminal cleavage/methylation domain-containing protein [Okeania sp. SIO2B3]|uniref:prepilin-type N-terminal cleavage/methylation domain-containing protein n=1 Tax=Okeania sp. SIO2B3 TaxID=2607784 RepID=UPI0013BF84DB|nr:prepilin-type N-terminal cleavage/methylation domain-containing protein [Okeania sp. SIO2B3]NET46486.1 transcriptional regulator [Okeania sp. SIO2B3]
MKNLVLSKLSQIYLRPKSTKHQKAEAGFSLIELVVIVLIIGILSAIAAPGWNAFITRQRIRTVNSQVLQALQKAQSQAKSKKEDVMVIFYDLSATPPIDPALDPPEVDGIEYNLTANGEIKAGMVTLASGVCTNENCTAFNATPDVTFDYLGTVSQDNVPFIVKVSTPDDGLKRCVIVETLLGGMRTAEGADCP